MFICVCVHYLYSPTFPVFYLCLSLNYIELALIPGELLPGAQIAVVASGDQFFVSLSIIVSPPLVPVCEDTVSLLINSVVSEVMKPDLDRWCTQISIFDCYTREARCAFIVVFKYPFQIFLGPEFVFLQVFKAFVVSDFQVVPSQPIVLSQFIYY